MRYTGPKKKLCRREWVNLFWTEKYDLSKSKRGPLRGRKTSWFWLQLRKKQLAKRMFWLSEKQFFSYFPHILYENQLIFLYIFFR